MTNYYLIEYLHESENIFGYGMSPFYDGLCLKQASTPQIGVKTDDSVFRSKPWEYHLNTFLS